MTHPVLGEGDGAHTVPSLFHLGLVASQLIEYADVHNALDDVITVAKVWARHTDVARAQLFRCTFQRGAPTERSSRVDLA